MPPRSEMERDLNPWDIVMGACLGTQMSFVVLRLAGLIDGSAFLWGQIAGIMGGLLMVARIWHSRAGKRPSGQK